MAAANTGVYGMLGKADFLCTDFFAVAPRLLVDAIFVSPPWGGPKYQVRAKGIVYSCVIKASSVMTVHACIQSVCS